MYEKIFEIFEKKLAELKESSLYRSIKDIEHREGMNITVEGKKYINFASNDYLGLSQNPMVKEAVKEAVELFGSGAGASRLLCGGTFLNEKLERLLCDFKDTESSIVLNSGYTANTSLIPAITDEGDVIFSDELNHASIIDGIRLSKAQKIIYRHNDIDDLLKKIKEAPSKGKKIIITDTVFSMDGDIAPLKEIYEICKSYEVLLYIDDAHGTGVLGDGHGAWKHFALPKEDFVIHMGTLSKAIGCFGAFVCGANTLIQWFINFARGFIFSTALPASVVASAIASIKIIMEDKTIIDRLWENTEKVIKTIKTINLKTTNTQTPIIPILFDTIDEANKASKIFSDLGIYAPVIRPPTVKIPRIRITISAAHTDKDIERLIEAFNLLHQQLRRV
ncbi:MAG: pyridoxal phosphate-dependent aminotransferase family protein [Thermodesulfovibrio sp.]|uniref:aminotransferase class I/II-fold pyridoxal phosphate-dependent enzyme n=1 Tax=unclassified Thermodesulfovibrio TaxID=2645936 RepID=UPI00083B7DBF|nr:MULTISPECIES: pyridoxal phosphate-dependent aminotransferase family protein [unclassified Thermodesulfovibrio]MDI1472271.1 pyridoxal phosphate-dependent aminotransferase family protein [Thermodesulfovibrio sp. 1176]MDI6714133.1 pyridoxal phosphate-dependent aminotransferase family protein [Thermodesulfovibrio sp.]ODA44963.1 8-amino-7-oxononanoate synthase [Thermodesulfovibrio sp. N1]